MNVVDFQPILTVATLIISLGALAGGIFAYRQGFAKTSDEIQNQVITALKNLNETQASQIKQQAGQIKQCEKEIARLGRIVNGIRHLLRSRGIMISIHGDFIEVQEPGGATRTAIVVQQTTQPEEKEEDKEEDA